MLCTGKSPCLFLPVLCSAFWAEAPVSMAVWRDGLSLIPAWGVVASGEVRSDFLLCPVGWGWGGKVGTQVPSFPPQFLLLEPCPLGSSHLSARSLESPLTLPFLQAPPLTCRQILWLLPSRWFSHLPLPASQPPWGSSWEPTVTFPHQALLLLQPLTTSSCCDLTIGGLDEVD